MRRALAALLLLPGCGSFGLVEVTEGVGSDPLISVDPDGRIEFGTASPNGRSQSENAVVMSLGDTAGYVASVWVESSTDGVFFLNDDLPFPKLMDTGEQIPVTVRFQPSAAGTFHGTLVVETGTDGTLLERPLVGTGCNDSDGDGNC